MHWIPYEHRSGIENWNLSAGLIVRERFVGTSVYSICSSRILLNNYPDRHRSDFIDMYKFGMLNICELLELSSNMTRSFKFSVNSTSITRGRCSCRKLKYCKHSDGQYFIVCTLLYSLHMRNCEGYCFCIIVATLHRLQYLRAWYSFRRFAPCWYVAFLLQLLIWGT